MGYASALDMSQMVSMRQALSWHIKGNHYPPLPDEYIDLAEEAINLWNDGMDADTLIPISENLEVIPRCVKIVDYTPVVELGDLLEILHLDPWLER